MNPAPTIRGGYRQRGQKWRFVIRLQHPCFSSDRAAAASHKRWHLQGGDEFPQAGIQRNGKAAGGCPRPAPCGGCRERKLRDARPCGRLQAYPTEPEKRLSIMYSKEDILFKALNVNEHRWNAGARRCGNPCWKKSASFPPIPPWNASSGNGTAGGMKATNITTGRDITP